MATISRLNSFGSRSKLRLSSGTIDYYRLSALLDQGVADPSRLPFAIKILLEGTLRSENGIEVTKEDVEHLARYNAVSPSHVEVPFMPVRVLMQDFTGVPSIVDLAALRSALARMGRDPQQINPLLPVDLIIDHSVQVDAYGTADALATNAHLEFDRNRERYEFLHWGQKAFCNFRVVPPASGICHQVNLEYLSRVVWRIREEGGEIATADTLVGMDSHTTMVNGLGVLGWGVGGIEAEAALLGQPVFIHMPVVVGVRLIGALAEGVTATDLVLTVTELLRKKNVVGKFVEFFGPGISNLTLPDRATVANMAPEYGASCGFFPVDDQTLRYMRSTGRPEEDIELTERYCKEQGLFRTDATPDPLFNEIVTIDLSAIVPSIAGYRRPQDRIALKEAGPAWRRIVGADAEHQGLAVPAGDLPKKIEIKYPDGSSGQIGHGAVVIAAITSCTNTSNPWVMLGAGLLAKKAVEAGLRSQPFVKTSLAPGSKAVTRYLGDTGLTPYLDKLGFQTVGYGCTTCIGNSGPLPPHIAGAVETGALTVVAVLSGNRNFAGRINALCKGSFLASPPIVIAYALAGSLDFDFAKVPLGRTEAGTDIYLKDIWPTDAEISALVGRITDPVAFREAYETLLTGNETWNKIESRNDPVYPWNPASTYIREPSFFKGMTERPTPLTPIVNARVLALFGDSVTTDHISPAGGIGRKTPAGKYLVEMGVKPEDFNSYGSRRGNDEVMARATFANIRIKNLLAPGTEGGVTLHQPSGEAMPIYDAAMRYKKENVPVVVIAGADYGMGSSRDWAAKGVLLLGVRAVIAESFERIHLRNLSAMGVLPLQFQPDVNITTLKLTGHEAFTILVDDTLLPRQMVKVIAINEAGEAKTFELMCRIDSAVKMDYFRHGGILQYVLRRMIEQG